MQKSVRSDSGKKAKKQKKKLTEKGEEKFFLRHQSQCVDYIRRRSWFGETPRLDVIRITLSSHVAATTRQRSRHLSEESPASGDRPGGL